MVLGNGNMLENEDEGKEIDDLPFMVTRQHHHSIVDGCQCQSHRRVRTSASQLHGTHFAGSPMSRRLDRLRSVPSKYITAYPRSESKLTTQHYSIPRRMISLSTSVLLVLSSRPIGLSMKPLTPSCNRQQFSRERLATGLTISPPRMAKPGSRAIRLVAGARRIQHLRF